MDLYDYSLIGAEWWPAGDHFEWCKIPGTTDLYALRDASRPEVGTLRGRAGDLLAAGIPIYL